MKLHLKVGAAALGVLSLAAGVPASAEVTQATDDGFVSRHEVVVAATPKDVWLALISPAAWWRSEHTWSGDSKNLSLMPTAGGCFCEAIPEVDEPGRFTLEGSVEHMRVIQAYPETALRMVGALGPLQSEPVSGVLTIAISKTPKGTRIVWEYNVGGSMRYEVPVISKAVDGVMGAQLAALAKPLVVVATPAPPSSPSGATFEMKPAAATVPAAPSKPMPGSDLPLAPAVAKPAAAPAPKPAAPVAAPTPEVKPIPKSPTVEDVFGDFEAAKPG